MIAEALLFWRPPSRRHFQSNSMPLVSVNWYVSPTNIINLSGQPPKSEPKIFQILIRTHQTTLFFTVPPSTTIGFLKEQTLSALNSGLNEEEDIPPVKEVGDFELCRCRGIKGKDRNADVQREYDILDEPESTIKGIKLANWEVLYLQFKDEEGMYCKSFLVSYVISVHMNQLNITCLFTSPSIISTRNLSFTPNRQPGPHIHQKLNVPNPRATTPNSRFRSPYRRWGRRWTSIYGSIFATGW